MSTDATTALDDTTDTTDTPDAPQTAWGRLREKRWVQWVMDLSILAVVFFGVQAFQSRDLLTSATPAPDFALSTLDGRAMDLASLRGKKTVLVLWAPWCTVCKTETGTISALHRDRKDLNVVSIALGFQEVEEVRKFASTYHADYPIMLGDESVSRAYRVKAFPTTYLIDEEGKIRHALVGYTSGFGLRWRLWTM